MWYFCNLKRFKNIVKLRGKNRIFEDIVKDSNFREEIKKFEFKKIEEIRILGKIEENVFSKKSIMKKI